MCKKVFLIFLLAMQVNYAHADDKHYLDSVQAVLDTAQLVKTQLLCLYTLSFENGKSNPRKAIEQARQCLALAESQKDTDYILHGYNALGNAYETLSEFDSAVYFHEKSYQLAVKLKSKNKMIVTLANVANCNKLQGNYQAALEKNLLVYRMMESESVYNYRAHYTIADLYIKLGDYKKAVEHSLFGIYKIEQGHDEAATLSLYVTLSKALFYQGQTDSACAIIKTTIEKYRRYTDDTGLATALNLLGEIYLAKKNYSDALPVFTEALQIDNRLHNNDGIGLSQVNIAYCHVLSGKNKALTLSLLQNAEDYILKNITNSETLIAIYSKLADAYGYTGNNAKAYFYSKRYSALNDSILNYAKYKQIIDLQTQFESEKVNKLLNQQKAKLEMQSTDIQKRKLQFIYLSVAFALMILSGLYLYSRYRSKQKIKMLLAVQQQEKEKEQAIKEKETQERLRISKDIHDELGAGISKISIIAEYSKQQIDQPVNMKDTIDVIAKTSQEVADNMHDLVWSLNPENATLDSLAARIREYAGDYLEELPVEAVFTFPDEIPSISISKEFQRNVFLTCKEAINNAVKHANATKISIQVKVSDNLFSVEISDDGKGMNEETKRMKGNGLRNMQLRIESIGGNFELISDKGVHICLTVPLNHTVA